RQPEPVRGHPGPGQARRRRGLRCRLLGAVRRPGHRHGAGPAVVCGLPETDPGGDDRRCGEMTTEGKSIVASESQHLPPTSRRSLIRTAAAGAALAGTGSLSACVVGGGGAQNAGGQSSPPGEQTSDNPLGVDKAAPLEVVIFNGGYGEEYGKEHVELYNAWAGGESAKMSSTVKIASTLQSRFAGGNPPEVIDNSGADLMPTATLVADNQLADLTPLLESPSVDDPNTKVKDLLMDAVIKTGSYDGVMRQLPYVFSLFAFWYSKPLFEE